MLSNWGDVLLRFTYLLKDGDETCSESAWQVRYKAGMWRTNPDIPHAGETQSVYYYADDKKYKVMPDIMCFNDPYVPMKEMYSLTTTQLPKRRHRSTYSDN